MRQKDAHEDSNEGYFASVSDLMVGILFIFLLLLTVFAINYQNQDAEKLKEKLKEVLGVLEKITAPSLSLDRIQTRLEQLENGLKQQEESTRIAQKRLLAAIEKSIETRNVGLSQTDQLVYTIDDKAAVLRLTNAIPFERGKWDLNAKATRTVRVLADVLTDVLPCYLPNRSANPCQSPEGQLLEAVLIEGHTDSTPFLGGDGQPLSEIDSKQLNDELSTRRALSVLSEITLSKPDLEGLKNKEDRQVFGISGYGQRRLLDREADSSNRRIDVRFILYPDNNLALLPIIDDIKRMLDGREITNLAPLIQSIHELVDP